MTEKLLPCPFCGGEASMQRFNASTTPARIICQCGIELRAAKGQSVEGIVEQWNTRAAVTDGQFARTVHDGRAWEPVRTCRIEWRDKVLRTENGIKYYGNYYCTACNDALSSWAKTTWDEYQASHFKGESPFRHCPNCGAKVVCE